MAPSSVAAVRALAPADAGLARIRAAVDLPALVHAGYDPERYVFAPDPDDPTFGFRVCAVANCEAASHTRDGLCTACRTRRERAQVPLDEFIATPRPFADGRRPERLCLICRTPGHERPALEHGLCRSCGNLRRRRGQTVEGFIAGSDGFAPARPRATFGRCRRAGCGRLADGAAPPLCVACRSVWKDRGRPDLVRWSAAEPVPAVVLHDRRLFLGKLSERLRWEVLLGLHAFRRRALRFPPCATAQVLVNALAQSGCASALKLAPLTLNRHARRVLAVVCDELEVLLASREEELARDSWRLRLILPGAGPRQRVDFSAISQPWLREGVKRWVAGQVGVSAATTLVERPWAFVELSASLALRRDRGVDPAVLGRADVAQFLGRLAQRERAGTLSRARRVKAVELVRRFLREARELGLQAAGRPLAGLCEQFAIPPTDVPRKLARDEDDDIGRSLPHVVVAQLLEPESLELLERLADPPIRRAIELLAATGRRPHEIAHLRFDCLAFDEEIDEDGRLVRHPVLVYRPEKRPKSAFRLPIDSGCRALVTAQQQHVHAQFPRTKTAALALFPRVQRNVEGRHAIESERLGEALRVWTRALARLLGPDGEPYDRGRIVAYAFRHSYAQRHADAGTPVEVLRLLMDHDRITTTQGYFRISARRRREAVLRLAPLQLDARGLRLRPLVDQLLESDVQRRALGQTAVPFGACTEPSNVKAHGQACPFRMRCVGCSFFRTDASHQDELQAHLGELLAARERLLAAQPELAEWARRDASPSDQEIAALRNLIRRNDEILAELQPAERAGVEEAIGLARAARDQLRARLPDPARLRVVQSAPTFAAARQRA